MHEAVMLMLQAAAAVAGPPADPPMRPAAPRRCPAVADPDEVVVCAADQEQFRLRPLPPVGDASALPRARVPLGAGALTAETEQASVGGFPSNRVMVRFRLPF